MNTCNFHRINATFVLVQEEGIELSIVVKFQP